MASQSFDLSTGEESDTIVLAANEVSRVRFEEFDSRADVRLEITRNSVTTEHTISDRRSRDWDEHEDRQGFIGLAVGGDTVRVKCVSGSCKGIIEGV